MATVNKSGQLHSKAANGDVLKLYPNTLIANVEGLQLVLDGKVNTVSGKGLSTNDYTTTEKNKLAGIAAGATANIGTVTQVKVGSTAYNPSSGVVSLPAYPTSLPASDVSAWAKASTKPSYTASEVGLGNVGNYKAVSTVASQGLSDTEKSNARANIGAGTSSFSGSYNDLSNKPTIPTKTSQLTNDSGYTTNTGTVTQVKVGSTAYNPSSGVISLPAYPSDTNTHRPIQINGTEILGNNTTALNLKAGSNVSLSNSSGTVTIAATDTTYSAATQSVAGLMSAADKKKLDGVAAGATANVGTVTGVKVGTTSYSPSSGIVSLPAYPTTLPASDVYAWAKAATKPSYTAAEIGIGAEEIVLTAGTGFTITDSFTYKSNNLAWISLMVKNTNALTAGQSYTVASVDGNTIKRGAPIVVLNAYDYASFTRIKAFMDQWSTQGINIISESNLPADSWIFISGVYRFY